MICCLGLNPQRTSNGVSAIAISGLWLESGYLSGLLECSCSAWLYNDTCSYTLTYFCASSNLFSVSYL